jgi:hypothetical protein
MSTQNGMNRCEQHHEDRGDEAEQAQATHPKQRVGKHGASQVCQDNTPVPLLTIFKTINTRGV